MGERERERERMAVPRKGRQQSRDGLSRLLRVTDKFGLLLVGVTLVAYFTLSDEKKNKRNGLSGRRDR